MADLPWWYSVLAVAGLTLVTVIARTFFLWSQREQKMPVWLAKGLQYAPVAALSAVVVPGILLQPDGSWHWQDARLFAALGGLACYYLRRNMLDVIVGGMLVFLPLRLFLGW